MKHEKKHCDRCNSNFECKVGDIGNCQCSAIQLSAEEIAFVKEMYDDCLCMNCIYEIKEKARPLPE